MTDHTTPDPVPHGGDDGRRPFETYWRMNPVTRSILDHAIESAVKARAGAPIDLVLDVGCGRQSNVVFPGARRVIGTDVDVAGLENNVVVDTAVAADIVQADLPEGTLDAIACIYVLEHVAHPDWVFGKLARALRPGGVMVIAVPIVSAPKAQVTKHTPFWFHRFVYERLLGRRGGDHGEPFPTVLDSALRPDRLENLARVCGLEMLSRTDFEDNKQGQLRARFRLTGAPWRATRRVVLGLSGGRVDPEMSDVVFAFQKTASRGGELAEAIGTA
jgi:ubiquinone/menaquinone biosynthesis C-methylase UbiE